ncbi:MAG: PD-(D/E)XK nuclease family transposase [Bacteroidales bacterium]|nr:PD-(D/E)XK nuclease family transposase [Bacteroidales bacterium]
MNKEDIYYISPLSDFGFKKCFRDEIVMKGFLNALFKYAGMDLQIETITYLNNESDADTRKKHRVIFDLKCKLSNGEYVIVEMQNERQSFIDRRILYYMSRGVSQQGDIVSHKGDIVTREEKREWDFDIKKVIGVFLFNFNVPGEEDCPVSRHCIVNVSKRGKHISNDLFEYWKIQLPHFRSKIFKPEDCKKLLDCWLFNISNMDKMNTTMPFITKSAGLSRLNELGRFHAMSQKEQDRYIKENFDDVVVIKDVIKVKMQESREEGRAEGERAKSLETAAKMKLRGYSVDVICDITGLTPDEVGKL